MAVIRIHKTKDYTVMSNRHLRERSMTLKAKGMMSILLSLPEDWKYSTKGLETLSKDGYDATGEALRELEQHGYLIRTQIKEKGKFKEYQYDIYEQPQTEKPLTEKPQTEKPEQLNTKESIIKEIKKENNKKEKFKKPTIEELKAYKEEQQLLSFNPEQFLDYYEANGWKVGKNNMKDWKATARNWNRRNTNHKEPGTLPDWFNKEKEQQELTKEQQEELNELFQEFK